MCSNIFNCSRSELTAIKNVSYCNTAIPNGFYIYGYYTPYATLQDVLNRYNEDKAEGEKLPLIPFHGLRHTNATILIASNENIKAVSAAETSTTMNIYAHALIQTDKAVANRMEKVLAGQVCS